MAASELVDLLMASANAVPIVIGCVFVVSLELLLALLSTALLLLEEEEWIIIGRRMARVRHDEKVPPPPIKSSGRTAAPVGMILLLVDAIVVSCP